MQSDLMQIARNIQREADAMLPSLTETGNADLEAIARMEKLRHKIITAKADGPTDTLMQFGCVRSVAGFLHSVAQTGPEDAEAALRLIELGTLEILTGLDAIRKKLEADAGVTLEGLGLFVDTEKALQ